MDGVDPRKILDYVAKSRDPVSDPDLYRKFRVGLSEIRRALRDPRRTNPIFYRRDSDTNDYRFSSRQVNDGWKLLRPMECEYECDDGGREASGFVDMNSDCVIRALAIAAREPYQRVYQELSDIVVDIAVTEFRYNLRSSTGGVSASIYGPWLEARGWNQLNRQSVVDLSGGVGKLSVWEFINEVKVDWDKSAVILSTQREGEGGHLVAVVNGVICDLDDCSGDLVEAAWMKDASRCSC